MGKKSLALMGMCSYLARTMITQFISEAKAYCDSAGIKLSTLGQYAVADNTLFRRLEAGGQCMPRTIDRVRAYMAANPAPTQSEDAA